jgi:cell division protein FtsI/penicillin-binding protein 2
MEKNLNEKINTRISILQGLITLAFILLTGWLFGLQILDLSGYKAKGTAMRSTGSLTLRGNIVDRNGIKLATDELTYEVYAHPRMYSTKRPPEVLAEILYPFLEMPKDELLTKLKSKKMNIITLKKEVNRQSAEKIRKLGLREISIGTINRRFYPQGNIASHIIGFYSYLSDNSIGIENIAGGKLGINADSAGAEKVQRMANGDIIFDFNTDIQNITKRQKGEDITLTIDASVQYICEKELAKTIKETKAERGTVIVEDVTNGEILAYASYPNFDPNKFWEASMIDMKNWSLTDIYPPGSTFKIITVATAIDLGVLNEYSKVPDTGRMIIDKYKIENHDYKDHPNPGMITLDYLFEHSSNVASANIALMLDKEDYYNKLYEFGFGQKTGIDLTAESVGLLPKPKSWYKSRQASMGYGYGASVTAIQMISAISAIANNGVRTTPHVIKYSAEELPNHVQTRQVISPETARAVTRLLAKSIANGNTPLNLDKYTTCAKTGTSRKQVTSGKDVYASAIGYFPASAPKVAIYVVIDSPKTGVDYGGTIASPLFRRIATEVGTLLNIPSDKG